jgi:hypothetical protein
VQYKYTGELRVEDNKNSSNCPSSGPDEKPTGNGEIGKPKAANSGCKSPASVGKQIAEFLIAD